MADNIIRNDIIQLSFDVDNKGLTQANKQVDEFKKSFTGGFDSSINKLKQNINGINKSVDSLGKSKGINKLKSDIETANAALGIAKDKFSAVGKAIKGITTHPIKTLDKTVLGLQMSAGRARLEFKNLAKTKVDNLKTKISDVKNVLTEGQTGAKGFGNALKNIGKIGIGKAITGFSSLKNNIKQSIPSLATLKGKLTDVVTKLSDIGKKAAGAAFKGLKKVATVSFKALSVGIGAAATAVSGLVVKSVQAFGDYEQLVGGVETLFKDSAPIVQKYANDAYKTAGLSANEYMETVTGFSASLLQSLGGDTKKAAEYADMAVKDMSDNANKMGTDMGSIQFAYQGFAKQNYTMLDNLKLGYGGTKTEMERLVKDAAKLDKSIDANSLSYGNIVKAIHAVQVNMGIYGTTQKEAEKTITGSLNAMKSAWGNLLTAMGSGEGLDQCINNMVNAVETFGNNLMPVAEKALLGIGTLLERLVPKFSEKLPVLAEKMLPPLLKASVSLVQGIIKSLPSLIKTIVTTAGNIFEQLISSIGGNSGNIFSKMFGDIKGIISDIVSTLGYLIQKIGEFFSQKSTLDAIAKTWNVIKKAIKGVWFILQPVIELIANNLDTIIPIIMGVVKAFIALKVAVALFNFVMSASPITWIVLGIVALIAVIALCVKHWDKIKAAAVACWNAIKVAWGKACEWFNTTIIQPILSFFKNLWGDIKSSAQTAWSGIKSVWATVCNWFNTTIIQPVANFFKNLWNGIKSGAQFVWNGICNVFSTIANWINTYVIQPVIKFFKGLGTVLLVVVLGIVGLICQGFLKIASWVNEKVIQPVWNAICSVWGKISTWVNTNVIQPVVNAFKLFWFRLKAGIMLVWTVLCAVWGKITSWVSANVITPVVNGFKILWSRLKNGVVTIWNTICNIWGKITSWVNSYVISPVINAFKTMWNGLKNGIKAVWNFLCNVWGKITSWVSGSVIQPIKNLFKNLWDGIKNIASGIKDSIVKAFKTAWDKVTGVWNGLKDFFTGIWNGLKDTGGALKNTLVGIWKSAVSAIAKPVNKLIGGANWVLEKLGSEKRVAEWKPYAKGTDGHKGGNALVNDGRGAELLQMPNGRMFIPQGRNVFLPNAPKGMKVLPAEQTANLMGRNSPTFRYEKGTNGFFENAKDFVGKAVDTVKNFDIWEFFDDAKGLATKVIDKFVSFKDMTGYTLDVGKAMISTAKSAMSSWISNLFKEFGGKDISSYVASKGVEQWRSLVIQALKMEGQYSEANVKRTLYQMQTESGGNPRAINLWDSNAKKGIPSKGLMQCIDPTFKAYARPGFDKNIYDPLSNILASIRYAVSRYGSLAKAYQGHGYANGVGTVKMPEQSKTINLHYTPENSFGGGRATVTEHNTYSPQFNLTITGDTNDRATERKVKRWISEAMDEVFSSLERKNRRVQEV